MRCPYCDFHKDRVVDSRESKEGRSIRRLRECSQCGRRFTSYERIEQIPYMVIKKGGHRETFQRSKILIFSPLQKALQIRLLRILST